MSKEDSTTSYAKRILKSELERRGIKTLMLYELLKKVEPEITERAVVNRLSRGTLKAEFFLQCLAVIGCTDLNLSDSPYL